jgi:hypothetical protein
MLKYLKAQMRVIYIKNYSLTLRRYSEISYPKFVYTIDAGITILYRFFDIKEKLSNVYRCMLYMDPEQYKKFNQNILRFEKNLEIIIYKNDNFEEDMEQKDYEIFKNMIGEQLKLSSML